MELDVTHMVETSDDMVELSGSAMEHGPNAGPITWNNSKEYGKEHPLLKTVGERDAARSHFADYGAWTEEEINAWTEEDLQAIMIQDVAAAIREADLAHDDNGNIDPLKYQELCEDGILSGRLFYGDDKKWYFYLGT